MLIRVLKEIVQDDLAYEEFYISYRKRRITMWGGTQISSTPPTAQTTGAIGLIFGLGALQGHRTGVTIAIFEFPSGTPKNRPPRAHWGWGPQNLGGQFLGVPDGNSKIAKVTPILCLWCTPSLNMDSIAQAVWAVGGGARDFGFWSLLTL